eukprot:767736-Hanusia_phi.AAC.4
MCKVRRKFDEREERGGGGERMKSGGRGGVMASVGHTQGSFAPAADESSQHRQGNMVPEDLRR